MEDFLFKKLKQEGEKYSFQTWENAPILKRCIMMTNTLKVAADIISASRLHARFDGETLEFNPINKSACTVKLRLGFDLDDGCDGLYDSIKNVVKINVNLIRNNDGVAVFKTLMHEFAHKLEKELTKQELEYPEGSSHRKYLNVIKSGLADGKSMRAFDIDCGNRLYLDRDSMTTHSRLNQKKSMLYVLLSGERHAFSMSESICEKVFEDFESKQYLNALQTFRKIYHCVHMSNDHITSILDRAQMHIVSGTPLNSAYEAVVAYDIAATLALQNKTISVEQYVALENDEAISKAINSHGYEIPWVDVDSKANNVDAKEEDLCDIKFLDRLSEVEQLNDPEMIFQIAAIEMSKVFDVIKNVDALKEWYYSKDNHIPIGVQEDLAIYLGDDFSPDIRLQRLIESGEQINEDQDVAVGDWNYIKSFNNEFDFCDNIEGQNEHDAEIER